MKIAIVLGSIREERKTHRISHYLYNRMKETPGLEVTLLDLAQYDLPILSNRWEEQDPIDENLEGFSKELQSADGIILCSPEYHGSYTGVLKNALDHYWKEFKGKPMGVVATGSGSMGGINASSSLQLLILSLGAYPMPYKLLVPFVDDAFDEDDMPTHKNLEMNTGRFIREFVWFARAISFTPKEEKVT